MGAQRTATRAPPAPGRPHAAPPTASAPDAGPGIHALPLQGGCVCGGGCPRCAGGADDPRRGRVVREMERAFARSFQGVLLRSEAGPTARADALGVRAFTDGREIAFGTGVFAPETPAGRRTIAHEFAHVAQLRGGNGRLPPLSTAALAEWQAERAAAAVARGARPRVSAFSGSGLLFDDGRGGGAAPTVATTDDEEVLATVLRMLDTLSADEQRSGAIAFLVGLAVQAGPTQARAEARLIELLSGEPEKNLGDHIAAVTELQEWVAAGERVYDLLLHGRRWFADRSKHEIGSGLVVGSFQKWLHYRGGRYAIDFLRRRAGSKDTRIANLAARIVADLLDLEDTPEAKAYGKSYAALRAMARANGWESFGSLGAAAATPRIFSALAAMRQQADRLELTIRLGPVGDPWEEKDLETLRTIVEALDRKGLLKGTTPSGRSELVFTAENRGETEHELLAKDPASSVEWLEEMARTFTLAAEFGSRVQARTEVLHANARALDQFLGAEAAQNTAERLALFDLRHEYVETWLSVTGVSFATGSAGTAAHYEGRIGLVEQRFERFDEVVAQRKFKTARGSFREYSRLWNEGNLRYPGNDKLDEKFFFSMRDVLERERKDLSGRFSTGFSTQTGGVVVRLPPSDEYIPTDLHEVSALDRDTSLFGLQAALFLVYATNLSIHNMMLKSDVGSSGFQARHGARLTRMRVDLESYWRKGDYDAFLKETDAYEEALKDVVEKIKDRAKLDLLLNLAITLIAALVTQGAALAVRLAALSRTLALARTARAVASVSTLAEIGVFTATELSLQKLTFGKEIGAFEALKTAATNLAFLGALKAVGRFAGPLAKGSPVRKPMFGHLLGFSGVAAVSATITRVETGEWPRDVSAFLVQTGTTYLLIAGMHHAFQKMVAQPALSKAAGARLEGLNTANEALAARLRERVNAGTLTRTEFEAVRAERMRLLEDARAVAKILRGGGVISAQELAAIEKMADRAVADAKGASFPAGADPAADPVVRALPAPESVIELTRVGTSNTYVYDPARPHAGIDALLARYREKGYSVEGGQALMRVVDPRGATRFLLSAVPLASTRLQLPQWSGAAPTPADPLAGATGLAEPRLSEVRDSLARINREAEAKLAAEYPDYTVLATLATLVEQSSRIEPGWSIDAVRGLADALSLERGIPRSAVRRLFLAIEAKKLPQVLSDFHDVVTSPKVSPGSRYLIADDLRPKHSVTLVEAWRTLQKKGIELPADMDYRAVRGLLRQIDRMPGGWLQWISGIAKEKRTERLQAVSGLADPRVQLPKNVTELLASIGADLPGHPGINPLAGTDGEAFVSLLEGRTGAGRFDDVKARAMFVTRVDQLRVDVALLQQGEPLAHGEWERTVGRANEVRQTAAVLLAGATIHVADQDVGPKGQLPNVDFSAFTLPGGGKVVNAPPGLDVHMDLVFTQAGGTLVAMEVTTAELHLPAPWSSLDPKDPAYGGDLDWTAVDKGKASHRKFMQAVKIYQLNKMARALGIAWSGKASPSAVRVRAGDFSVPAARALEDMGFELERLDGTRETAAQVEARKKSSKP